MKLKKYMSDYCIIAKTPYDFNWQTTIETINTPATIVYMISANNNEPIKKIVWDFGNGNQRKTFTNRKQDLNTYEFECKYKKTHGLTVTVTASVYNESGMFETLPIITTTTNTLLKDHYIEPEEFKNEILEYYKTGIFSSEVANSINKIANRLSFAPNFINYSWKEEMVGDAVIRMIEALISKKFDPKRGNPFSYFTKIAFHAFCNRIKKEKRLRETLTNYQNSIYSNMVDDGTIPYMRPNHTNDSSEYCEEY